MLKPLVCMVAVTALSLAATPTMARAQVTVDGQTLTSERFPLGSLTVSPAFRHIGAVSFELYGVAQCDVHLFVDAPDGRVERMYWVQFEGYLPDNQHTYDYSAEPRRATIGGLEFFGSAGAFYNIDERKRQWRQGSDSEHVMNLLAEHGYTIGPDVASVRLVRVDEGERNELMIIYLEDLEAHALTADMLAAGGSASAEWAALAEGLHERALAGLTLSMK